MIKVGYNIVDELPELINKPVKCAACGGKYIRIHRGDKLCPICKQKGKQNEYAEIQIAETLEMVRKQSEGRNNGSNSKD